MDASLVITSEHQLYVSRVKVSRTGRESWNSSIFHDSFAGSGTSVGPVVLGGVRLPIVVVGSNKKVNSAGNSMERWAANRSMPTGRLNTSPLIELVTADDGLTGNAALSFVRGSRRRGLGRYLKWLELDQGNGHGVRSFPT
jgi:hypothetical protein